MYDSTEPHPAATSTMVTVTAPESKQQASQMGAGTPAQGVVQAPAAPASIATPHRQQKHNTFKTQSQVLRDKTIEYLQSINLASPPSPDEIEYTILHKVCMEIDALNAVALKGQKLQFPKSLYPFQIALILSKLYTIYALDLGGENAENDNHIISVYCETGDNCGIYVHDDKTFFSLAKLYKSDLEKREFEEVLYQLEKLVPVKTPNRDRDLIAVNNGIFNYATKQLMPFSPDYIFVAKSHVDYVDNPPLPVYHNQDDNTDWDVESWMNELSDDPEIVKSLWEILGAILRPHVRWNKAAWLYSETGNNGKGTLCELMRSLLGKGAYASIPIADFSKDFLLEPLIRSQAIIVDENNVGEYLDKSANLKAVITNDVIQINRKFKTPITYQFYGFMVQCINELPRVKDRTDSFYRRQLLIPFTKCFTGHERRYIKNDYLHRKDTLEYVLWKVLNMDFYQLSEPAASLEALQEYKEYNDPVRQFANEMLPQCVWDLLPFTFLHDLYKSWFKQSCPSGTPVGKTLFISELLTILQSEPSRGWNCQNKNNPIRSQHKMDKPEYLIVRYGLANWRNIFYQGNDLNRICSPVLKEFYRGIQRTHFLTSQPHNSNVDT